MSDTRPKGWRVLSTGAVGIELCLWCGFGIGKTKSHGIVRLGIACLYARRVSLHLVVRAAREVRSRLLREKTRR